MPEKEPTPGHMGLMLSSLGVEPVVKLQAGGLKVAEVLMRYSNNQEETKKKIVDEIESTYTQMIY